jgi:hypothetical protein
MTVHFLGDNAAQLAKSFDGSLAGSQSFRDAINETARTQRHLDSPQTQPTPPSDFAASVAPMKYDAGASPNFMEPISLQLDSTSAPRLVRVNGSPSAALPAESAALPDNQNPWDDRFGNGISSVGGLTPRNPNVLASPLESEGPIGLFSGKPMRFLFAPIFQARTPSEWRS